MNILYISSAPSKKQFEYMQSMIKKATYEKNIGGMPESSYKFHNSIINGLEKNNCKIYSVIGRPVSNKTYKKVIWPIKIEKKENITYNHMFIINLPVIKQMCCIINLAIILLIWLIKNILNSNKLIIVDAAYISLIPVINFITRIILCKKIAIVADVYDYMAYTSDKNNVGNIKNRFIRMFSKFEYSQIDGYVFLTKKMKDLEPFKGKKYTVVEGIYDAFEQNDINDKKQNYIMYAGAIKKEFGLERLIESFMKYNNSDIDLLIFGNGDYVDEMKQKILNDKRIKYMGSVSIEEIQKYERKAQLLINPRPVKNNFTKYSFPSKIIEYMSTGTPVLTSKLSGIPDEYSNYVYFLDNDSVNNLTDKIRKILSKPKSELISFGKKAKNFILNKKNSQEQAKKILSFFDEIKSQNFNLEDKLVAFYLLFNILVIFFSILNPFGLFAVSFKTYAIYICSVIFTILGIKYKKNIEKKCSKLNIKNSQIVDNVLNSKTFIIFLFISLLILIIYCAKYIYLVITTNDGNYRMIAFTSLYGNALSAIFYNYIISNISKFSTILLPIVIINDNIKIKNKKLIIFLLLFIFMTYSLIGLGRANFLLLIISTFFSLLYFKNVKSVFTKKNIKIFIISAFLIFTVSCIYLGLRLFNNDFSIMNIFSVVKYQIKQIFDYFLGSFRMLDLYFRNGFEIIKTSTLGRATMAGFDEIIIYLLKGFTDDILSFNQIIGPVMQEEYAIGSLTPYYNAFYTSVINFYLDFKIVGVILFSLLHGIFIKNIFKIYNNNNNFISQILIIFVSYNMIMTVMKWEYQSGNTIFMIFILLFIIYFNNIKKFFGSRRKKNESSLDS